MPTTTAQVYFWINFSNGFCFSFSLSLFLFLSLFLMGLEMARQQLQSDFALGHFIQLRVLFLNFITKILLLFPLKFLLLRFGTQKQMAFPTISGPGSGDFILFHFYFKICPFFSELISFLQYFNK